jgi:hypothetical protein
MSALLKIDNGTYDAYIDGKGFTDKGSEDYMRSLEIGSRRSRVCI